MDTQARTSTQKKSPVIAVLASFFIPGLGQIYSGEIRKGIGFIIIAIIFVSIWLLLRTQKEYHMIGPVIVAGGACVLLWIGNMFDAYKTAQKINSQV